MTSICKEEIDLINCLPELNTNSISGNLPPLPNSISSLNDLKSTVQNLHHFISINFFSDIDYPIKSDQISQNLTIDGEPISNFVTKSKLFEQVLHLFSNSEKYPTIYWWNLRCILIYQAILIETAIPGEKLRQMTLDAVEKFSKFVLDVEDDLLNDSFKLQFYLESSQALLQVFEYKISENFLNEALKFSKIDFKVSGVLGSRTKFQRKNVSQLVVVGENNNWDWESNNLIGQSINKLNKDVLLENEDLLPDVKFIQDETSILNKRPKLSIEQQSICLSLASQMRKLSAAHKISDEQQCAYIHYILDKINTKSTFNIRFNSLLIRTKTEMNSGWRRVDRAIKQIEELCSCPMYSNPEKMIFRDGKFIYNKITRMETIKENDIENKTSKLEISNDKILISSNNTITDLSHRFVGFYTNLIPTTWVQKRCLVDFLIKMGCGSTALDLLINLGMVEDAAKVYAQRGQESKAIEIIEKELKNDPSKIVQINLYCCLGDVTKIDDNYYQTALKIAESEKQLPKSRVYRSLGYFYYFHPKHKNLQKAINYFTKAVKINPLQNQIWFCLGCAGLAEKNWDLAVSSFRRSTLIEWDNYQGWANLASALIKKGDKISALRALQEATKCSRNNTKLWENYLTIATEIGNFTHAILAYNKLIDLKSKFTDLLILKIICENYKKVVSGKFEQDKLCKRIEELLVKNIEVDNVNWKLYEIYGNFLGLEGNVDIQNKSINAYIKSYRSLQQSLNFPKTIEDLEKAKEILFKIKHFKNDEIYVEHHPSIITALSSLKKICENQLTHNVDNKTRIGQLCQSVLTELE